MGETHRKIQIGAGTSTESTIMSIWVGSGNDPGNTRLDLSIAEWDDLIDYFKRLFEVT